MTQERLRVDGLRLRLGAVFTDHSGKKWVYCGLAPHDGGQVVVFHPANEHSAWTWVCAYRDALEQKFVDLPKDLKYGTPRQTGYGSYENTLGLPIMPDHCRIETDRNCGCGLGQCARGLIY